MKDNTSLTPYFPSQATTPAANDPNADHHAAGFRHVSTPTLDRLSTAITSNQHWDLIKREGNITLYKQRVPDSTYDAIRATMVTPGKLTSIKPIIENPIRIPELLSIIKQVNVLNDIDDHYKHLHLKTEEYWPLSPINVITQYEVNEDETGHTIAVKMARTDQYDHLENIEGDIVNRFEANILFKEMRNSEPESAQKIEVIYESHLEPGSPLAMPFLVNPAIFSETKKTMENIQNKFS